MIVGAAALRGAGTANELAGVVERGDDLVLDIRGVRSVVAAEPPGGGEVCAALHELRQTGGAPVGDHAASGGGVRGTSQDKDAVADRADGPVEPPIRGHLVLK